MLGGGGVGFEQEDGINRIPPKAKNKIKCFIEIGFEDKNEPRSSQLVE